MTQDQIRTALLEQKAEKNQSAEWARVRRGSIERARSFLDKPWVKVITGVRRCGKSVFCHQILEGRDYGYVNFDDERLVTLQASQLQEVLAVLEELYPGVRTLLFDEIQNVEGWELFVNRLLRQKYNLIITGSNSHLLSRELATHLTGRHISFELFPFSFREFLSAKKDSANIDALFDEYLLKGGFPEMVVQGFVPEYLRELYDKIITRDIAFRRSIRNIRGLRELALLALSHNGTRITYQKMAKILGFKGANTPKNYLSYLEESYLVSLVAPYSAKVKEQIRQPRKLYAIDNGMWLAMNTRPTPDRGAGLEAFVHQELRRRGQEIWNFLDPVAEVDFLLREGRTITGLIQSCWSLKDPDTHDREVRALLHASRKTGCQDLLVITRNESGEIRREGLVIRVVRAAEWALEVSSQLGRL